MTPSPAQSQASPQTSHRRRAVTAVALLILLAVTAWTTPARAQQRHAAPDSGAAAERQARGEVAAKAFVQGHYEEALAIYADLYVKSGGRPEYLRNIGRCQQRLNQHDRAIASFRDYLRLAKQLSARERSEVEGFIAEMEAARAQNGGPTGGPAAPAPRSLAPPATPLASPPAAAAPAPVAPAPAPEVAAPSAAPASPALPAAAAPAAVVTSGGVTAGGTPVVTPGPLPAAVAPAAPAPSFVADTGNGSDAATSANGRGSMLKPAGLVVLGAAAALTVAASAVLWDARSTYDQGIKAGCATTNGADCESKAKSVESANLAAKVLFAGAGIAGAAGLTMVILAPGHQGETRVSVMTQLRF
ncbi:MAG: tetratricopeptide repeat protein [Pseudomonadota bacterium]